ARGRVVTSRSRPRLLGLHAILGPDGAPLIEERPWTDPWVSQAVEAAAGEDARLVRSGGVERFDILPLLVATDGAIAAACGRTSSSAACWVSRNGSGKAGRCARVRRSSGSATSASAAS